MVHDIIADVQAQSVAVVRHIWTLEKALSVSRRTGDPGSYPRPRHLRMWNCGNGRLRLPIVGDRSVGTRMPYVAFRPNILRGQAGKVMSSPESGQAHPAKRHRDVGHRRLSEPFVAMTTFCFVTLVCIPSSLPLFCPYPSTDFGVYVSTSGDIIGRAIDWTSSRISAIFFAVPYFFLIAENHIEVRLVENGRKLETVQGEGFRPLNGIHGTRTSTSTLPGGIDGDSYVEKAKDSLEDHPGLLHLITRRKDSDSEFDFVELQMEVLDLAP